VFVISDETVAHHYEDEVEASLKSADIEFDLFTIPPGEASKTQATAASAYDWLLEQRAERGHTIVAVGGGVVTDLGGFVAATFARGLPLVHVPTSLLGMVDAAIGGKVAVNHPKAKNMIGAFYHPRLVLEDPALLRTLPPREIYSGWAEALKHAMIADENYLRFFEENADSILKLESEATTEAIRRSVVIKAGIVSADERETTGRRTMLNYGHTLAHAIESTTGYTRFGHGEADGIGMTLAAAISVRMGLLDAAVA
jgi:3-dehydroquinate synthase